MHVLDQLFPLLDVSASILPACMFIVQVFTLDGHGCTCNGAKQIKIKCPCRCNHAIHMVLFFKEIAERT